MRRREWWGLAALVLFTLMATAGYWNFALHPERLPGNPLALRFYTVSFRFFAQIHILLSAVALGVVLLGRLRLRWVPSLLAVYGLAFLSEHVGTGYGVPFGGYAYTGLLGAKLGGRVPVLIPLSWFLMSVPAFVVARAAHPGSRWRRVGLAALMLVVWDLALDPAMSFLTPYWVWEDSGPYYGMPWVNLLGWFLTGAAIMSALEALAARTGLGTLPVAWMAAFYLAILLMPVGMLLAAGHVLAVGVTAAGVGACAFLARRGLRPAGFPGEVEAASGGEPSRREEPAGRALVGAP